MRELWGEYCSYKHKSSGWYILRRFEFKLFIEIKSMQKKTVVFKCISAAIKYYCRKHIFIDYVDNSQYWTILMVSIHITLISVDFLLSFLESGRLLITKLSGRIKVH